MPVEQAKQDLERVFATLFIFDDLDSTEKSLDPRNWGSSRVLVHVKA